MAGSSSYDVVAYDDFPVAETHPDRLFVAARRAGVELAGPERVRVLELGCAHGVNLLPMAFHLPQARFVGVDLSPVQIDRGRSRVTELGLDNLELRCADVMALDLGDARFDIIIAHGLISWVPDAVRDRVLELCRDHLAPSGVAYLSYNAMPAWGVRGAIKRALQIGTAGVEGAHARLERARSVLETLAATRPLEGTAEGAVIAAELDALRDRSDAYLLHEYLVPHGRAYYVGEMVELAAGRGLSFIGDVAEPPVEPAEAAKTREAVHGLTDDPVAREELADILEVRQFRASLFCRTDAPRDAALPIPDMHASAEHGARDGDDPAVGGLLELLAKRWPQDLPVSDLADATGRPIAEVAEILEGPAADRVELRARSLAIAAPSERPSVTALSRFEAHHLPFVTTPRHAYAPLDDFHAALLAHLDGTRGHAELADALADDVEEGRLQTAGSTPPRDRLRASLEPLVRASLGRLHAAGLFVDP